MTPDSDNWTPIERVCWRSKPLICFLLPRARIEARFGPPLEEDVDSNGVGLMSLWAVRFRCGLEVALEHSQRHPGTFEASDDAHEPRWLTIYANDNERNHLLLHLTFENTEPSYWQPDTTRDGPLAWRVMRRDDNGHVFEMARFSSRCEAEAVALTFEQHGHKQMCWVEHVSPG